MVVTHRGIIHRWKECEAVVSSMRHHGHATSSLPTYRHALMAYANAGQCDRAVAVLSSMRKHQVVPTIECYELVLKACQHASRPKKVLEVWKSTVEANILRPTTACLNAVVGCCAMGGYLDDTLRILKEWKGLSDTRTYELALEGCAKEKDWKRALGLLGAMKVPPDAGCYGAVLTACAEGEQWEKAEELLGEMRARGVMPQESHYLTLMQAFSKAGKVNKVLELLGQMKDEVPTTDGSLVPEEGHYQTAMWASIKFGDASIAIKLFFEMDSRGIRPSARTYMTLLHAYRKVAKGEMALQTWKRMKKEGLTAAQDPHVFKFVFGLLCHLDRYDLAGELVEAGSNEEVEAVSNMFANEMMGMIKAGNGRRAVGHMRDFYKKGLKQGESFGWGNNIRLAFQLTSIPLNSSSMTTRMILFFFH